MFVKIYQLSLLFIALYAMNNVARAAVKESYGSVLWGAYTWCEKESLSAATPSSQRLVSSFATVSYQPVSYAPWGRKKRSDDMDENDYQNGTMDQFVEGLDENCDGYLTVTEWVQKASLEDFVELLNAGLDVNGDGRLTLEELQAFSFRIYPTKDYMLMPMGMYEEMKGVMDMVENEQEEEGKGRKDPE